MLWHIFKNGWEDKQFIEQRVYGMDDIRKAVEKWDAGRKSSASAACRARSSSASPRCLRLKSRRV